MSENCLHYQLYSGLKVQFKLNQKFELSTLIYLKHDMKYQLDTVFYIKREREREKCKEA